MRQLERLDAMGIGSAANKRRREAQRSMALAAKAARARGAHPSNAAPEFAAVVPPALGNRAKTWPAWP